jgi:tRNA threonylcarbamoyladenosine biosynthesis protein TsaB
VLVLAWDTSTPALSLALARVRPGRPLEPEILAQGEDAGPSTHSSSLPPLAESVLAGQGLGPGDLSLVAAGTGPGSFTGLRVGLAFAKGLAFGGVPAVGVPSLAALALGSAPGLCAPLIDARHGELFLAIFRAAPGLPPEPLSGVLVARPPGFFAALRAALEGLGLGGQGPVRVLGPGLALLPPLEDGFVGGSPKGPCAASVAALGAAILASGEARANPPEPLYGRSPEIFKTWVAPARLPG